MRASIPHLPCPFCGASGEAINFNGCQAICTDCRTEFRFYPRGWEEYFGGETAKREWNIRLNRERER